LSRPVQVVRHRSPFGEWEWARREPDPRLAGLVRRIVGYSESVAHFPARRELATPDSVLIVSFRGRVRLEDPLGGSSGLHGSFAAGVSDSWVLTGLEQGWGGVQVDLTPPGAYTLFGGAVGALARRVVALEDVFGPAGRRLVERLEEAPGWPARFDVVESSLLERAGRGSRPLATVAGAWHRLVASGGRITVRRLAEELGCSRKHLAERFTQQLGLPPKTLAALLRFQRAWAALQGGQAPASLAEAAQRFGFYDQAHMARDFRRFAGGPPSALLALRLPDDGGVRHEERR
jgi:AraC-like DNA-binding protein